MVLNFIKVTSYFRLKMNIRIVSAIGGDVFNIEKDESDKIIHIKEEITRRKRVPANIMVLAFRGSELRNENITLGELGVIENDKIYLITRTEGG